MPKLKWEQPLIHLIEVDGKVWHRTEGGPHHFFLPIRVGANLLHRNALTTPKEGRWFQTTNGIQTTLFMGMMWPIQMWAMDLVDSDIGLNQSFDPRYNASDTFTAWRTQKEPDVTYHGGPPAFTNHRPNQVYADRLNASDQGFCGPS